MKKTDAPPRFPEFHRASSRYLDYLSFLILFAITSSCMQHGHKETHAGTRAERDSLYNSLADEEKRFPANALAGLEPVEGLQIQLFAAEPQLLNPTNMDIDEKGRVWITEAYNYRPTLNPQNPQRAKGDRIVILEDTNGDGSADTTKVFYEGTDINSPLGIAVLGDKVIVSCSPNVYIFTDSDGDDQPDKKEVLFTGIKGEQHDHGIHAFVFGPDGKLYFNYGNEGGQLQDRDGNTIIDKDGKAVIANGEPYHQGMVFRANMNGSEVEVLAHNFRNNYELAVDSYGTIWQSDNDDDGNRSVRINYVMEYGNYGYSDEMTGAGWRAHRTNIEQEIPFRHWHLNDPGVVPNLIQTGAGSPTGMIVYEGNLLPEPFLNEIIHADPGHNIIRSYPVSDDGAGYTAEIVNMLKGVRDQWFRPSDITVAPDGSLFVADWYDPGVGGHQMGDMNRGRIYRITPTGTAAYKIPAIALGTAEGAVEALKNPNLSVRYLAWTKLNSMGTQAEAALLELWQSENPRFRARALWLLGKIESSSRKYIQEALQDKNPDIRITALRIARQSGGSVIPHLKLLVKDKNAQVRREAALALRHNTSPEAPALWTELAMQYDGTDRWYLEALGIGANEQWDSFFAAWRSKAGDKVDSQAGKDIIWRARAAEALPLLAERILDPATLVKDRLRYFRAFDFHKDPAKEAVLLSLLDAQHPNEAMITKLTLNHLKKETVTRSPKAKAALQKTLASASIKKTQDFVNLVDRYQVEDQNQELLAIVLAMPDSSLGVQAASLLLKLKGNTLMREALIKKDGQAPVAVLTALKKVQTQESMALIASVLHDKSQSLAVREHAVKCLGWGWDGEEKLLNVVKEGKLPKDLEHSAATTLASVYRQSIRQEAAKYLTIAKPKEGDALKPVAELIKRKGSAEKGKMISVKYCHTCHLVKNEGIDFGPALSEIGDKLPKEALYDAIIDPDAGISFGFEGYTLRMKDGNTAVGIVASETADEITLKMPGGISSTYNKAEVSSKTKMNKSLMPADLHHAMSEDELVDLVAYLSSLKASGKTSDKNASL